MLGFGDLRAAARLTSLVLRTRAHLSHLPEVSGDAPAALRRGQIWAGQVLGAVGVDVVRTGSPPAGPVLIVANHRSYIDIPLLLAQLPCTFLAKREISRWPLFGTAAARIHSVFVERECPQSRAAARIEVVARLQRGLSVVAFPEGTTSREPGVRPFYPGLFEEARRHDFPVCPVAIRYADPDDAWVDDAPFLPHFMDRFRKPGMRVYIAFGPTVRALQVDDLREHAHRWIGDALASTEPVTAPVPRWPAGVQALPA